MVNMTNSNSTSGSSDNIVWGVKQMTPCMAVMMRSVVVVRVGVVVMTVLALTIARCGLMWRVSTWMQKS